MWIVFVAVIAGLLPLIPALFYSYNRRRNPSQMTRGLMMGLGGFNVVVALMVLGLGMVWFFAPNLVQAAELPAEGEPPVADPYSAIAAAAAVGVGSIGMALVAGDLVFSQRGAVEELIAFLHNRHELLRPPILVLPCELIRPCR